MSQAAVTILVAAFGVLFSLIGFLALLIFNDLRRQVQTNTRHIESILHQQWGLIWRVNGLEDWADEKHDYVPPRVIGKHEGE